MLIKNFYYKIAYIYKAYLKKTFNWKMASIKYTKEQNKQTWHRFYILQMCRTRFIVAGNNDTAIILFCEDISFNKIPWQISIFILLAPVLRNTII